MKKTPYKVVTLATLIAFATTSNVLPIKVFAQEKVSENQKQETNGYELGPKGMKEALAKTGSNTLAMNIYALTVIKTPIIDLSKLSLGEEGEELAKQIQQSQKTAIQNANYWLDTVKPNFTQVSQDILSYNIQFQNYYDNLVNATNTGNKALLKEGLGDLLENISQNQKEVAAVINMLKEFKGKLYTDSTELKAGIDGNNGQPGLLAILSGQNAILPKLKKEIEVLNNTQKEHFNNMLGWGIGGGIGTTLLIGAAIAGTIVVVVSAGTATPLVVGVLVALASAGVALGTTTGIMVSKNLEGYNNVSNEIKELSEKASIAEKAVISLTSAKSHLTELYQTVDQAILSLTTMKKQWDKMGENYQVLIDNIDSIDEQNLKIIKNDLESAKKDWQDIKHDAELIANDISKVKN
ncbi:MULTISPECIES: HBL/NHE enterotoxin family protein [unclassified Bacillus (in: firmicutes)]|uniref:HBL/NHE enterotoxin family protein n=1 Tax=unclassified Bacillus (in: firmicutes) TaxID=185979 RepID=UPI000E35B2B5|nr:MULTISPECIES: HBL/NHE enterotoxin family protein [unclassified Bacillus (in: firmicutes)]AXR17845.1 hemolysin BL lytic component L1 [Bacillus sp. CR71]AXR23578.1 hemolysin BL lytic component L1 [Bacillus sp. E25]